MMKSYADFLRLYRERLVWGRIYTRMARRFLSDESGAMLVFGVYVFLIILMVAGIGIDFMRYERDRVKLQATLDRAVLAAMDLNAPLDPDAVVEDYFEKSGLDSFQTSVIIDNFRGYRHATATASTELETQFMHMNGVDSLTAPATGSADEQIENIEISLVLDVSETMNENKRLQNLIVAAEKFVDTLDETTPDGDLSMSIVPYAAQVSIPNALMEQFNTSDEQRYSRCINFETEDFSSSSLSYSTTYQTTMHFDPWFKFDGLNQDPIAVLGENDFSLPVCEARDDREILLMQNDPTVLKDHIRNLTARGNASIDIGMKWGAALLDPRMRSAITSLSIDGIVPTELARLPRGFDDGETLKVVILMTNGENSEQYYINEDFRTGPSDIYFNDDQKAYSVYSPEYGAFYWPDDNKSYVDGNGNTVDHGDKWADHPYGENRPEDSSLGCVGSSVESWDCEERQEPGTALNIPYPDLWAHVSITANLEDHYYPFMTQTEAQQKWEDNVLGSVTASDKNIRTRAICDAAKDNGIIVFTIGFDAPPGGASIMKYCASSDANFFEINGDTDGEKITNAFSSIASSIRKLRLTQ